MRKRFPFLIGIPFCLALLFNITALRADEDRVGDQAADLSPDPALVRSLAKLEKRMGVRFDIPFPANFDPDHYRKRPLARIEISGKKVVFTRPIINPYDEPRKIEWMIGPEDPVKLGHEGIDCAIDLDERGEFQRLRIIADWAADHTGNHQTERADSESGRMFFERARLTYQSRAKAARDSEAALRYVQAFEKIATTIEVLGKEEIRFNPGTSAK